EIGQPELAVLPADAAVQAGDVPVLGEEHVAPLAAEVESGLGHGVGVARRVAADDEGEAADEALRRAAHALDPVGRLRCRRERLDAQDLLPDPEDVAEAELDRLLALQLAVDAVE